MERSLELYSDGHLYEFQNDQPFKVTETQGQVDRLIEALRFSIATTFTIAPPEKIPPEVPEARGSRHLNLAGFKLLTAFEGCELSAYDDGGGVWTIGYGHTSGVYPGMKITQAEAETRLREDLEKFETYVENAVQVSLSDNQFSALVCFCFNVGPGTEGFGGSTLLRLLNQGNYQGSADEFPRWNKVNGKPWLGLTRRRLAEQALFLDRPWEPFLTYEETNIRVLKLTDPLMQGEDVRQLQAALKRAGMAIEADGYFGKGTETAVKQFQAQKSLNADGIVGDEARKQLGL
ncbi:MAG: glycoside hydrolase family protein [Desertifilum sp. SIO1I2]|nr:glycoside hydrolase family protein [Desertifilum sp. SIO1I2]